MPTMPSDAREQATNASHHGMLGKVLEVCASLTASRIFLVNSPVDFVSPNSGFGLDSSVESTPGDDVGTVVGVHLSLLISSLLES